MQVTWGFYQDVIAAYSHPRRPEGKKVMTRLINTLRTGLPRGLEELAQLGRTLWHRRDDILAHFVHRSIQRAGRGDQRTAEGADHRTPKREEPTKPPAITDRGSYCLWALWGSNPRPAD
nr:hypothetical protein [Corynebacterium kalidii]